jgi:hypothetical protein
MFPGLDFGKNERFIAKPLFNIYKTLCNGSNSSSDVGYTGLRNLNPNPATTTLVGKPWRVRRNVWIPIIAGVVITDSVASKQLWINFVAIINPDIVEELNTSGINPLPTDVEAKIAGTPNTGECF